MSDIPHPANTLPTTPVEGDELPSVMEMMVEIKKYWTTANGEPELKEFAEYVLGIIRSHTVPTSPSVHGDDWLDKVLAATIQKYNKRRMMRMGVDEAAIPVIAEAKAAIQAHVDEAINNARSKDPYKCEYGHEVYSHKTAGGWCCACDSDIAFLNGRIDEAVRRARLQHCIDLSVGLRYGIQAGGLAVTAESLTKDIERYREQLTTQSKHKEGEDSTRKDSHD